MPILTNIDTIYRGEDISLNFTMTPVVNITGWTLTFTVRDKALKNASLVTSAGSVTSGPSGTFSVPLTAVQTDSVSPGIYEWDVWRTDLGSASLLGLGLITFAGSPRVP